MAYLYLVLSVLFWAGNFVSARAIHFAMDPVVLAFARWVLVLILISPWALPRIWRARELIRAHLGRLILLSGLGVAAFNTCIYLGVRDTTATNAMLMQSFIPILILLFAALFWRESIPWIKVVGILLSLAGIVVLLIQGDLSHLLSLHFNQGDLWVLCGVVSWALYSVALRLKPAALDGFTFFSFSVLVGVLILLPIVLLRPTAFDIAPLLQPNVSLTVIYMAVCPSILSYLCWNRGVAEIGAASAGIFIHLLPLFGMVLAVLFLGEQIRLYHGMGVLMILAGVLQATLSGRR